MQRENSFVTSTFNQFTNIMNNEAILINPSEKNFIELAPKCQTFLVTNLHEAELPNAVCKK